MIHVPSRLRVAALATLVAAGCALADSTESIGSSASNLDYDPTFGAHIASVARRVDGRASGDMCLAETQNSLEQAGVRPFPRLPGAVDLDDFLRAQGDGLRAWGFEKQDRGIDDIPLGSIVAWRPGQCGYSAQYGHIEIAIGGGRACSDFCGNIAHGCGAPDVFVPTGAAAACAVNTQDHRLYCANRTGTPLRAQPTSTAPVVDTLRTTYSWFDCWTNGELHAGGNTTWYSTRGDDSGKQGFAPAFTLQTTSDFDANPTSAGLPHCQ